MDDRIIDVDDIGSDGSSINNDPTIRAYVPEVSSGDENYFVVKCKFSRPLVVKVVAHVFDFIFVLVIVVVRNNVVIACSNNIISAPTPV